jgi:hypothetical protein
VDLGFLLAPFAVLGLPAFGVGAVLGVIDRRSGGNVSGIVTLALAVFCALAFPGVGQAKGLVTWLLVPVIGSGTFGYMLALKLTRKRAPKPKPEKTVVKSKGFHRRRM